MNNPIKPPEKQTPNQKRMEMLQQAFHLLSTAVDALTVCVNAQEDGQAMKLLDPAIKHQWEARYWLSETIAYLQINTGGEKEGDSGTGDTTKN